LHQIGSNYIENFSWPCYFLKCWCIPPEHNAAFVAAMEDVLEIYSRPYDKNFPVVCMDEKPLQTVLLN